MKAYVSKYALTGGVSEVEGEIVTGRSGTKYFKRAGKRYTHHQLLTVGKDVHDTREAAVEAAEFLRARKLASLRNALSLYEDVDISWFSLDGRGNAALLHYEKKL